MGGDDELADLRRRAFSRDGTAEDLRRLAELETPAATPVAEEMAEPEPPAETVVDAVAPRPAITARSRLRGILLAGAVGITLGATAATLGIQFAPRTEPTPAPTIGEPTALAIFDREPGELDDPARLSMTLAHILPGGLEDAELRWLGAVAEREVYVARGSYDDVTTICLISATSKSTGAACTDQSDFAVRGLSLGDGQLELRWGPLGTEIWVADRP